MLAIKVPGVKSGELTLDGKTLGDIYLSQIKKWNDPAITKLNPGLNLPDQAIAVSRRADGSGTSFVFTSYLAKVYAYAKQNHLAYTKLITAPTASRCRLPSKTSARRLKAPIGKAPSPRI